MSIYIMHRIEIDKRYKIIDIVPSYGFDAEMYRKLFPHYIICWSQDIKANRNNWILE